MSVAVLVEVPGNSGGADVADDPLPERVVQVGDQALFRRVRQHELGQQVGDRVGVRQRVGKTAGQLGLHIEARARR